MNVKIPSINEFIFFHLFLIMILVGLWLLLL